MKKLLLFIQKNHRPVYLFFVFALSAAIILYIYPGQVQFKYDFQKGKTWQHQDLVAPFSFTIQKTSEEISAEKNRLAENKDLFFERNESASEAQITALQSSWSTLPISDSIKRMDSIQIFNVLDFIYSKGIIERVSGLYSQGSRSYFLNTNNTTIKFQPEDFYTVNSAADFVRKTLKSNQWSDALKDFLKPNVTYNHLKTEKYLEERLAGIITNRGFVRAGELIIAKGNVVDARKYQMLTSLKKAYEGRIAGEGFPFQLLAGQLIYIVLLLGALYFFIQFYRTSLLNYIANINLILFSVTWMVCVAILVIQFNTPWLYIVPFPIVPIIMRAFYDTRSALFVHLITILLIGYYAPNGYEFIFIQFLAGMSAIINVSGLYKRSQLFVAALKIVAVYLLAYTSIVLLQENTFKEEQLIMMGYLVGSGFFSLLAFPLIYIYEKIFGQVSDLTLLELADTNSPLLRELAQQAPGTFQHSIQVANLAERAALNIGANPLLVRTGALYHDVGKMQNPLYFVENQVTGVNPHDDLSFEESAEMIIAHVLNGVKLAKKNRLPEMIIDFIRTHHGTSKVEYFYRQYVKSFPEDEITRKKFTYPGPIPFSKETAILMMADSVEAATRSMKEKTNDKLNKLIDDIIEYQLSMGQFNNSNITLKEIEEIKHIFKHQVANIYHSRIEYPEKIK